MQFKPLYILDKRVIAIAFGVMLSSNAFPHAGDTDPNHVHACVDNKSKAVRIVGINGTCRSFETAKHWNIVGPQGLTGDKGDKGDAGVTGADGDKGDTGLTGAPGQDGAVGAKGDVGDIGQIGLKGDQGDPGVRGTMGPKVSLLSPLHRLYGQVDAVWLENLKFGIYTAPM